MNFPPLSLVLLRLLLFAVAAEDSPEAPRQGAALLKMDIMGVFAHPDDETGVAGTLALYGLGKGAVIANVYCTRGEGGGNMVGTQSGAALGVLREAELRDCLGALGVRYCYFLDQLDWACTESATATLRKWGKEETLGRLVRMIRTLCPEVIFLFDTAGKVRAARDADANQGPVEASAPGTRLFSKRTPDGYRIQVAIPFEEIGIGLTPGKRLGFNVIVYDGDEAGAALGANINQSRIAWSPRSGVQGRPEDWGRIELE